MKDDRQYQQDARHWVNREWNNSRDPLLVMPAGSGKTYTAALIVKDRIELGDKLLILVGVLDIFDQWILEFASHKIDYGYIADGEIFGRNKKVYICMWKTLNNMLPYLPEKFTKSITKAITDEAHGSSCPTLRQIYDHFENANRLFLTATPFRNDNQPLGEFCDVMYEPITQQDAIKKGYLCEPIIILPEEYKESIDKLEKGEIELKDIIKKKTIIGNPFEMYKKVFDGAPVMVACDGVEHSREIAEKFRSYGWIVEHIHGLLDKSERRRIIKDIRNGKINILVTYNVGSEGLDIVNLMGVMWLTYTGILKKWIQLNTRAARIDKKNKKKTNYVIIDFTGNYLVHGSPSMNRIYSLHNGYDPLNNADADSLAMQRCPNCGTMNSVENNSCWICKCDFETLMIDGVKIDVNKRKLPRMIDGRLVWLEGVNDERLSDNLYSSASFRDSVSTVKDNTNTTFDDVEPTKAEKIEILKKDLTGLNRRDSFKRNVGWL